ncbi:hypothetical protein GALL_521640 [mine drainage metagenome]|uniref:Uncharacterized protein n=1 Tax=mine drainage metagenome TaxID=410659 RepID=A0A1J5PFF4_9ZZZZ
MAAEVATIRGEALVLLAEGIQKRAQGARVAIQGLQGHLDIQSRHGQDRCGIPGVRRLGAGGRSRPRPEALPHQPGQRLLEVLVLDQHRGHAGTGFHLLAGQQHERLAEALLAQFLEQLSAIHDRHVHVRNHQSDGGVPGQLLQGVGAALSDEDIIAGGFEGQARELSGEDIVIHHKDRDIGFRHGTSLTQPIRFRTVPSRLDWSKAPLRM